MSDTYPPTPGIPSWDTDSALATDSTLARDTTTTYTAPSTTAAPSTTDAAPSGTADVAKDQAANVAQGAKEAGAKVASTAKDEAAGVASEVKGQAKDLYTKTRSELVDQAGTQQQRVATGLQSLSDELGDMANNSSSSGVASDLVHQVAQRAGSAASWLEQRDPGSLLQEVRTFARQRPGTFIAIAAVAGVVAGRLTRSVASVAADDKKAEAEAPATTQAPPVTPVDSFTGTSSSDDVLATGYASGATAGTVGYATTPGYTESTGYTDGTIDADGLIVTNSAADDDFNRTLYGDAALDGTGVDSTEEPRA